MIENIKQLLDVMESAALRQAAHVERTAHDPVARQLDMRQCIFAALVAAQAEGAVMVPRNPTPDMTAVGWPSRAVEGDLRMIWDFYSDMLTANPLRIKE